AALEEDLLDARAVVERAVRRAEIAQQVAVFVLEDLEVVAADGLVRDDEVVVLALADPDDVAVYDQLLAGVGPVEHRELRLAQADGPRTVLHADDLRADLGVAAGL